MLSEFISYSLTWQPFLQFQLELLMLYSPYNLFCCALSFFTLINEFFGDLTNLPVFPVNMFTIYISVFNRIIITGKITSPKCWHEIGILIHSIAMFRFHVVWIFRQRYCNCSVTTHVRSQAVILQHQPLCICHTIEPVQFMVPVLFRGALVFLLFKYTFTPVVLL